MWDIQEPQQETIFDGHTSGILCEAITCGGTHAVTGSEDKTIRVWNINKKRQISVLEGHMSAITSVATTQKYILSASADSSLRVWKYNY